MTGKGDASPTATTPSVSVSPPPEVAGAVNSIIQKVIALCLLSDDELNGDEGKRLIKSLRRDVKKLLLSSFRT